MESGLKKFLIIGIPIVALIVFLSARVFFLRKQPVTLDASQVLAPGQATIYGKSKREGDVDRGMVASLTNKTVALTVDGVPVSVVIDDNTVFSCLPGKQLIGNAYVDITTSYIDTTSVIVTPGYKILNAEVLIQPNEVSTKAYYGIRSLYVPPKEGSLQKIVFFDCR